MLKWFFREKELMNFLVDTVTIAGLPQEIVSFKSSSEGGHRAEFLPFWRSHLALLPPGFLWLQTKKFGDCLVRSRVAKLMMIGKLSFFLTLTP